VSFGKVKWFNPRMGFGFILQDDGSYELFFHYSGIEMDGFVTFDTGQKVEYDVAENAKGRHAINVIPISD
jgi:CspA family cold shock protein